MKNVRYLLFFDDLVFSYENSVKLNRWHVRRKKWRKEEKKRKERKNRKRVSFVRNEVYLSSLPPSLFRSFSYYQERCFTGWTFKTHKRSLVLLSISFCFILRHFFSKMFGHFLDHRYFYVHVHKYTYRYISIPKNARNVSIVQSVLLLSSSCFLPTWFDIVCDKKKKREEEEGKKETASS